MDEILELWTQFLEEAKDPKVGTSAFAPTTTESSEKETGAPYTTKKPSPVNLSKVPLYLKTTSINLEK